MKHPSVTSSTHDASFLTGVGFLLVKLHFDRPLETWKLEQNTIIPQSKKL